jgi:hypothetical protein
MSVSFSFSFSFSLLLGASPVGVGVAFADSNPAASDAKTIALPGGPGPVSMDYLAVEDVPARVWVPAGNTGNVDIVDIKSGQVTAISGFPTSKQGERVAGPSSVTIGPATGYVGNRGDTSVCAIDRKTLKKQGCATLTSMPDGLAYVGATHEVWATTPRDSSLTQIDVTKPDQPKVVGSFKLEGRPEGYAVDQERGIFFTNFEDKDRTLAIDVHTHKTVIDVPTGCGEEGPRGMVLDSAKRVLFVACTDHVVAMDAAQNLKTLAQAPTSVGLDNIDFLPSSGLLFAVGGKSGTLTVLRWVGSRTFGRAVTVQTAPKTRVVVVGPEGTAFVADSAGGRLLAVPAQNIPPEAASGKEPGNNESKKK